MLLANDGDDDNDDDDEDMKHHLSLRSVSMSAFSCCVLPLLLLLLFLNLAASVGGAKGGPCREAGDAADVDIGSKTVGATVVFDGEATVALPDQTHGGRRTVQFRVRQTLKGSGVKRSEIVNVANFTEPGANLSIGSRYLVFVDGPFDLPHHNRGTSTGAGNSTGRFYRLSSLPEEVSKKAIKEVRNHACAKCALPPKITKEPKNGKGEEGEGQKLTLHCRASGKPTPCITWYKDGVLVKSERRSKIKEQLRDSRLQIRTLVASDSGLYRCQATNLLGNSSSRGIRITVRTGTLKPHSNLCRDQSYCLNEGICYEVSLLKEQYCVCDKDKHFYGRRCEEKLTAEIVSGKDSRLKKRKRKHLLGNHHHHQQQQQQLDAS